MALTEQRIVNKIELVGPEAYRTFQIRYDNLILKDGNVTHSGNYERIALSPGSIVDDEYVATDVTSYSTEIQNLTGACWTDDTHTTYEAYLRAQL